ncbi:MAG: NHL repeat-containing protein, partial [Isosphaeraceae bacterium]
MNSQFAQATDLLYVSTQFGNVMTYDVSLNTASAVAASGSLFSSGYGNAYGIAFDKTGNLYVSNEASRIYRIDSSGNGSVFATAGLNVPWGLAFDAAGNLYAANLYGNNVTRYDSSGNLIGGVPFVSGLASGPIGLAFDTSGNLYVARGAGGNTITRYDSSGNLIGGGPFAVGAELVAWGLDFDSAGNLYAANYSYNTITRYDSSGNQIGDNYITTGLNKPQEFAFDSRG